MRNNHWFRLSLVGLALIVPTVSPAADGNFRISLTGDSIIDRRISVYREPNYLELFARIRNADAAFTKSRVRH
jgi:hypothetical protein